MVEVSGDESLFLAAAVDLGAEAIKGGPESGISGGPMGMISASFGRNNRTYVRVKNRAMHSPAGVTS